MKYTLRAFQLLLALGLSSAGAAPITGGDKTGFLKGESSLRIGPIPDGNGSQITQTETHFVVDDYSDDPKVFKAWTRSIVKSGIEGIFEHTVVEAYPYPSLAKKLWSRDVPGGNFKTFNDELVQVTETGCCGAPDLNHLIRRQDGKMVATAWNDSTLDVVVPNSDLPMRYIAQVEVAKTPAKKGSKTLIGSIGYFDGRGLRGVARVYANLPDGWGADITDLKPILNAKDEVQGHTLNLWSADGTKEASRAFSGIGFSGEISYNGREERFRVLVNGDQLDPKASSATSDLELEFVKF